MPFDIDTRIGEWRNSLLDTTKRNRLIKFVTGRAGGIKLLSPKVVDLWCHLVKDEIALTFPWKRDILGLAREVLDAATLGVDFDPIHGTLPDRVDDIARALTTQCLSSAKLLPHHLLSELDDRQLAARLTRLSRNAFEAASDHGVTTLFAAFGFLRWFEDEGVNEELLAPLLLVPVRLERESVESEFTLRMDDDDILPNYCLVELLKTHFRIQFPSIDDSLFTTADPAGLTAYFEAIREKIKPMRNWEIVESAALGVFNFQKLAMWEDLGRCANQLKEHPLCRAIAGDAEVSLDEPAQLPHAAELDRDRPPESATHILDADSSQHEAIEAVKCGANLVMDGPPGTGKSQTIANIIAEALVAGRTVLFVSEKTAALDIVKRRLDRCRLGDFCLELHSHKASKKRVVAELGRCLELPPTRAPDIAANIRQLTQDRQKLNEFVAELHANREPFGWSVFRAHGELALLDRGGPRSRVAIKDVRDKDAEFLRRATEILSGLADCATVITESGGHPWRCCKLTTFTHAARDDAEYAVGRLSDVIPPAEKAAVALAAFGFGEEATTVPVWRAAEADARAVLGAPPFPLEWFHGDALATARAIRELDQSARQVQALGGRLPEFDSLALRRITDPTTLTEVIPDRERLTEAANLTARARIGILDRIENTLAKLVGIANDLHSSSRTVSGLLQVSRTPTAERLGYFADVALQIADGPPIPPKLWDNARRQDTISAFVHAQEQEQIVDRETAELFERFHPDALEPESLMLVVEAARSSRSFWLRLLPRWWKIKKELHSWYRTIIPSHNTLCTDIIRLEKYHRRAVAVRQVAAEFAADLLVGKDGKPDWDASADRVRAIEWLEEIGVQHTFKAAAGPRRTLNRMALSDAGRELGRLAATLDETWHQLLTDFAVPDAPAQLARGASELAAWFTDEMTAVRNESSALRVMLSALAPHKDVLPGVLRERAGHLRDIVTARSRIAAARTVIVETRTVAELEGIDHSPQATLAEHLQKVLKGFNRPLSPPIVASFTDVSVREKLAVALRQSEAARRPFEKAWDRVTSDLFDPNVEVSTNIVLNKATLADLRTWAISRAADSPRLDEWTRFANVEQEAASFGLTEVLEEVKLGDIPPAEAADAFRARFFRLWLDAVYQQSPALGAFVAENHDRLIGRFIDNDTLIIRAAPERVRSRLLLNPTRPVVREGAPDGSELGILLREVNKKHRHIPLRRLFSQIPSILQRLKPCLMMSPLAVSTYLDTPELEFDLVIFDEASQVRPHEAVCSIYRGRQVVVVGDPRQLPPTDFFMRTGEGASNDADEDTGGSSAFESLLDICLSLGLPRKALRWHYRSRREALIAFSNRYFYEGQLITFPSAAEASGAAVTLRIIPDGRFHDGVNAIEAREVARMALDHARKSPQKSLGVIAFSQRQQERILDELEILRLETPGFEAFFGQAREEPFFVKNLENVQGDERDVIILSIGYGPDESGTIPMRFGPLNRTGGERRLNVAITRARLAMAVVSSMTAADVDLSRTGSEGAKLLKAFLDFAERGPASLPPIASSSIVMADSAFERAVGDELVRRGLSIERRVGFGGYIVDMAVIDPERGGQYVLGVECDGATYRAGVTARDRDRLRRTVLEGLGWHLVRIWSTDWVRDREKQVRRIFAALEAIRNPPPRGSSRAESDWDRLPAARRRTSKALEYDSIESVPEPVVTDSVLTALIELGSMPADDLVAAAAKKLGFKRTGQKIRERVMGAVNTIVTGRKLVIGEADRVRLAEPPRP